LGNLLNVLDLISHGSSHSNPLFPPYSYTLLSGVRSYKSKERIILPCPRTVLRQAKILLLLLVPRNLLLNLILLQRLLQWLRLHKRNLKGLCSSILQNVLIVVIFFRFPRPLKNTLQSSQRIQTKQSAWGKSACDAVQIVGKSSKCRESNGS
jgi:hypothetical protein